MGVVRMEADRQAYYHPKPGSRPASRDEIGRPDKIDSCYAYAADGEVVRARWPSFFRTRVSK